MGAQVENAHKSFTASEDITQYALVRLSASSGTAVSEATTGDSMNVIGVAQDNVASGYSVDVALLYPGRTYKVICDGTALAIGALCYAGATGYLSPTAAGRPLGVCLGPQAAAAAGDIVEFLYLPTVTQHLDVVACTASTSKALVDKDSGKVLQLDTGSFVSLPTGVKGMFFDFVATAVTTTPYILTKTGAATQAIYRNGAVFGTTADKIMAITVGAEARLYHDGTYWRLQARNASTWSS